MNQEPESICEVVEKEINDKKVNRVDKASMVLYSLVAGGLIDYAAKLNWKGIAFQRTQSVIINYLTGDWYCKWQEAMYKRYDLTDESKFYKRFYSDLIAFTSFQMPCGYLMTLASTYLSEGEVNFFTAARALSIGFFCSPFFAPTMRMATNAGRKLFGIESVAKGAYKKT